MYDQNKINIELVNKIYNQLADIADNEDHETAIKAAALTIEQLSRQFSTGYIRDNTVYIIKPPKHE